MDALAPLVRAEITEHRIAALEPAEREVFRTPEAAQTPKQRELARSVAEKLVVTPHAIALQIPDAKHAEAMKLAEKIDDQVKESTDIAREPPDRQFRLLEAPPRSRADPGLARRAEVHLRGRSSVRKGDLEAAKIAYDQGFAAWRKVLDRFPQLKDNPTTPADIMDVIKRYRELLKQRDEHLPKPFILQDILDQSERK